MLGVREIDARSRGRPDGATTPTFELCFLTEAMLNQQLGDRKSGHVAHGRGRPPGAEFGEFFLMHGGVNSATEASFAHRADDKFGGGTEISSRLGFSRSCQL